MKRKLFKTSIRWISLALILLLGGCASGMQKAYVDPDAVPDEGPTLTFNPNDLQRIAVKMANSLIATDIFDGREKPIVRITQVKNKTNEHIDTKAITDKIRTALIKSRKVKFVADKSERTVQKDLRDEYDRQMNDTFTEVMMDEQTKLKTGKMKGPKYHLFGEIVEISSFDNRVKDVYYKMTLTLQNLEEGTLEWADEKEIRKIGKRSTFGM